MASGNWSQRLHYGMTYLVQGANDGEVEQVDGHDLAVHKILVLSEVAFVHREELLQVSLQLGVPFRIVISARQLFRTAGSEN